MKTPDTIEDVIHEYHIDRLNKDIGDRISVEDAKELILAIVAKDMILNGGTVLEIEYEVIDG